MPLSTTTKVLIGVAAGTTAVVGGGIALARARKKEPKMKRDDGSRPDAGERPVASIGYDALYEASESEDGYPIAVGTRYEIALPKDTAAEFSAGRRIGTLRIAKIVNGEPRLDKAWAVDSDSFEAQHNEMSLAFDLPSKTISVTVDRAGLYVVAMLDRDGNEVLDDMVFLATAQRGGGEATESVERFDSLRDFLVEAREAEGGEYPADVGRVLEMPKVNKSVGIASVQTVSVAKVVSGSPLPAEEWSVHRGKLPLGFSVGTDLKVEYSDAEKTLRLKPERAGVYEIKLLNADGEDLALLALLGPTTETVRIRAT